MQTAAEQIERAKSLLEAGEYDRAEILCRDVLSGKISIDEEVYALLYFSISLWKREKTAEALLPAHQALEQSATISDTSISVVVLINIANIYHYAGENTRALSYYQEAYSLIDKTTNSKEFSSVLTSIGKIHRDSGNYGKAMECFQEVLSVAEKSNDKFNVADVLNDIGILHSNQTNYAEYANSTRRALALYEELGYKPGIQVCTGNLGSYYFLVSDMSKAMEYFSEALGLAQQQQDKKSEARNLGNIALVYSELSDHAQALEYFRLAQSIREEINDQRGIADDLSNVAIVYTQLNDYNKAFECWLRSLAISQKLGDKSGIAVALGNLAHSYTDIGDNVSALEYAHQALALHKELGDNLGIALTLQTIGTVYGKKDFEEYNAAVAEEHFLKSVNILEEADIKHELYKGYRLLSRLYEQEQRFEESLRFYKQYKETEQAVQTEEVKKLADKFTFDRQIAVLEKEREVTDMLLHKFLPSPIVSEVKTKEGKLLVEKYECVSALFADLVGFTKLSLQLPPEVLIEMLNFIFTQFDVIVKEAGGHRLRTIGDGYFAICGAPDRVEQHQYKLAKAAIAMQKDILLPDTIREKLPKDTVLGIRIGIHSGSAVCGMVGGLEKWQYDIYGDTVNTASRMESSGEPGKIHISEEFKNALAEYPEFSFIPREPVNIKGKGMMKTYFLDENIKV